MKAVTEDRVLEALRTVSDPDRGRDIVSLNMISGLSVREGHVLFAIEVDPERGAALEPVRQAAEKAVDAIPGVLSVTAMLTAHRAMTPGPATSPATAQTVANQTAANQTAANQTAERPAAAPQGRTGRITVPGVDHIVAVASGKGGVGKSTTAANLAVGLAAIGRRVGLLDADIYGPSMPRMMAIHGKPSSPDGKSLDPMVNYGVKVMSIGFMVAEETPMIWRGPMVQSALTQMLRDVNWGDLDVLVVDLPPGTGDAQLTMAQQVPLSGAVIVSTPQDIALLDARKGLNMFRKVDVPVLGIIENMSYFLCPSCGHRAEIFGHGGAREEAARLGCSFLGEVPLHLAIRETSDAGHPIVDADPAGQHALIYRTIAEGVWSRLVGEGAVPRRAPPRIVVK